MKREIIEVPVISQALRDMGVPVSALTRAGNMLYTCGMPPIDPVSGQIIGGDYATQARTALEGLRHSLAQAGATMDDVVKVLAFISDDAVGGPLNAVYREFFAAGFPARSCVVVKGWGKFDLEIECVAIAP